MASHFELFQFCLEIIKRELTKFNASFNSTFASQLTSASNVNFEVAPNRCAFMYRNGLINLAFARDCFKKFFSSDRNITALLSEWIKCPDLTVCSVSKGHALDYIALLLSYQECGTFPSLFKNVKVISKYGAWRNTVNIMLDILKEGYLRCLPPSAFTENIQVIQGDPFGKFNEKVKDPICNSDIILMVKTFNLQDLSDENKATKSLQEFLSALKPGAILFCIDTKPAVTLITEQLSRFVGKFLFEPTYMNTLFNLEYSDLYKDLFKCLPIVTGRGNFFVWQKSSNVSTPNFECLMDEVSESVKRLIALNNTRNNLNDGKIPGDRSKDQTAFSCSNLGENSTVFNTNNNSMPVNLSSKNQELLVCTNTAAQISSSVDEAIQTEPEDLTANDSINIGELSDRIANLTTTVSEMLQIIESDECKNDICFKTSETDSKESVSGDCIHNHCCPVASWLRNHPLGNSMESPESVSTPCKCWQRGGFENCQPHLYQHGSFSCNKNNSNVSLNSDFGASKDDIISCQSSIKSSAGNNSVLTPKLVIPLNNLSGSVVTQILSLVNQSNQEK